MTKDSVNENCLSIIVVMINAKSTDHIKTRTTERIITARSRYFEEEH